MADIEIREDNTEKTLQELSDALRRALTAVGIQAQGYATEACPVDTGLLHNSIAYALDGNAPSITQYQDNSGNQRGSYSGQAEKEPDGRASVFIGSNVEYASYVEDGTIGRTAKHFLRGALANHQDEYKSIIEGELKK